MVEGRTHRPVIDADSCRTCKACVRGCPAELIPEYRKEAHSLTGAPSTAGRRTRSGGRAALSCLPARRRARPT